MTDTGSDPQLDERTASYWAGQSGTYDLEPDHGLGPDGVRAAWRSALADWLPSQPCDVVDLGCGTGSLALLAAEPVLSAAFLDRASDKAERAGLAVRFVVGDASAPPLPGGCADVVLVRHVLWALPDPAGSVRLWASLLRPGGRFVVVEGAWWNGGGLQPDSVRAWVAAHAERVRVLPLTDPQLWGAPIRDTRYVVLGSLDSDSAPS